MATPHPSRSASVIPNRSAGGATRQRGTAIGFQPTYAGLFRCVGAQCEDPCCGDWDIPLDKITFQNYLRFPSERLGTLVSRFVSKAPDPPSDSTYAYIRRTQRGFCPFYEGDRLCGIQKAYGPQLLSSSCSLYPRSLTAVNGVLEGSLSLSCPEAARAVLLQEGATESQADMYSGEFRTDNVFCIRKRGGLERSLLSIRAVITDLIRDRSQPVWQRLLVIASLCSRLDELAHNAPQDLPKMLSRYGDAIGNGPSSALEQLEPDIAARLELVVALSDQRCRDPDCGPRFRNVFWEFIERIGTSNGDDQDGDVPRFQQASRSYLDPFLDRFPFVTENYLLNYVYQHVFPLGRAGSERFVEHSIFNEAVLLVTQFSWLMSLLTGVAGRYGDEFSQSQLILTVQSFTRATEHAPQILEDALTFVKVRQLDTFAGLAKLLRT